MPHIELNEAGWARLVHDCHIHNLDDLAELTGLSLDELVAVLDHSKFPDAKFVAACLGSMPATFNDLFVVKVPNALLVA